MRPWLASGVCACVIAFGAPVSATTFDCLELNWEIDDDGNILSIGPSIPILGDGRDPSDVDLVFSFLADLKIDDITSGDVDDDTLAGLKFRLGLDTTFFPDSRWSTSLSAFYEYDVYDPNNEDDGDGDEGRGIIRIDPNGNSIIDALYFQATIEGGDFDARVGVDLIDLFFSVSFQGTCTPTGAAGRFDCIYDRGRVMTATQVTPVVPLPATLPLLGGCIAALGFAARMRRKKWTATSPKH